MTIIRPFWPFFDHFWLLLTILAILSCFWAILGHFVNHFWPFLGGRLPVFVIFGHFWPYCASLCDSGCTLLALAPGVAKKKSQKQPKEVKEQPKVAKSEQKWGIFFVFDKHPPLNWQTLPIGITPPPPNWEKGSPSGEVPPSMRGGVCSWFVKNLSVCSNP